jgi:hypothetical protein
MLVMNDVFDLNLMIIEVIISVRKQVSEYILRK